VFQASVSGDPGAFLQSFTEMFVSRSFCPLLSFCTSSLPHVNVPRHVNTYDHSFFHVHINNLIPGFCTEFVLLNLITLRRCLLARLLLSLRPLSFFPLALNSNYLFTDSSQRAVDTRPFQILLRSVHPCPLVPDFW